MAATTNPTVTTMMSVSASSVTRPRTSSYTAAAGATATAPPALGGSAEATYQTADDHMRTLELYDPMAATKSFMARDSECLSAFPPTCWPH